MSRENRCTSLIARDYVIKDEHREVLTPNTDCLIRIMYDFVFDREIVIAENRRVMSKGYIHHLSTGIQVSDKKATWSMMINNQETPQGLAVLDPISITYDGGDYVNHFTSYTIRGELAQIQVEPYMEYGDPSLMEWDEKSYTRLYIDLTDGPMWWQSERDALTKKQTIIKGGYFPEFNQLDMSSQYVAELQTNSIIDNVPFYASMLESSLRISIHRRDGLIKNVHVPIELPQIDFPKLLIGDMSTILAFDFSRFTGRVDGDRTPPDDLAIGVL